MGMSDDLEAAIMEGATMVRVGTAIFGPRTKWLVSRPSFLVFRDATPVDCVRASRVAARLL